MSRAFTRRQVLAAAAGAMLGFGACQKQETASDKPELVLRYAENQPEDYPTTQAALAFGNLLEEQTGGRVKVAVYSKGELGAEMSVIQQIQFGGIDFARAFKKRTGVTPTQYRKQAAKAAKDQQEAAL